jgi:hypothetical protein
MNLWCLDKKVKVLIDDQILQTKIFFQSKLALFKKVRSFFLCQNRFSVAIYKSLPKRYLIYLAMIWVPCFLLLKSKHTGCKKKGFSIFKNELFKRRNNINKYLNGCFNSLYLKINIFGKRKTP